MPEQPPDPLHYDMKIPPEPSSQKQRGTEKSTSDQEERESNTAGHTHAVSRNDQRHPGREEK